ncbi:MAG: phosphoglucomutase/phosphomannomutase family protein [Vampirovibrionales bacterium]|nr:phosphoglucomutase/phosphomannomutase family protein [Cyanobacteria bacterium HKST-UBA03]
MTDATPPIPLSTQPRAQKPITFGTDGWRAVIAREFTEDNVALVTHAIARQVLERHGRKKPVIVGYDLRFLAPQFAHLAAEVLASYGLNVRLADTWAPTPFIAYAALNHDSAGAMMFTASHNPPEYLGIKFIPEYAGPAMPDITNPIVANVRHLEANPHDIKSPDGVAPGRIELYSDFRKEYIEYLGRFVQFDVLKRGKLKVLFDPMYGASQGVTDALMRECGLTVTTIHDGHDPLFGGRMPEPQEEYVPELLARVPAEGFDVGLSSDGDGDRFGVVDEKGNFLTANEFLPVMFHHLYKNRGFRGAVVRSTATSKRIDCVAEHYDPAIKIIETPVGFKWIGQAMRDEAVIIGGEESGGFSVLGFIPEKDGILANLLIAEMLIMEGKPLSVLKAEIEASYGQSFYNAYENHHLTPAQKEGVISRLKAFKAGETFGSVLIDSTDHKDGVKLNFGHFDWLLVRPSGTEPVVRVYLETTDADRHRQILDGFEALLASLGQDCQKPELSPCS